MKPGESFNKFSQRVEQETQAKLQKTNMKVKSDKKKEKLRIEAIRPMMNIEWILLMKN